MVLPVPNGRELTIVCWYQTSAGHKRCLYGGNYLVHILCLSLYLLRSIWLAGSSPPRGWTLLKLKYAHIMPWFITHPAPVRKYGHSIVTPSKNQQGCVSTPCSIIVMVINDRIYVDQWKIIYVKVRMRWSVRDQIEFLFTGRLVFLFTRSIYFVMNTHVWTFVTITL